MQEFIDQFIDAMRAAGCGPVKPSEIVANDKRTRYTVDGDRGTTRTGVYQLKVQDGFGVGWWRNYRVGETISWHSKAPKKFTDAERAEYRAKVEAQKKAQEAERVALAAATAEKAGKLWDRAKAATGTPYTARKGIQPIFARQSGDLLLVPIRKKQKLVSLQYVSPDGSKRFLSNGETAGGYCALAEAGDDFGVILICEGYATGVTIRESTGFPVIVAFNASNLAPVAKEIKGQKPGSILVIAADSDQWVFRPGSKPEGIEARDVPGDDPRWAVWRESNRLYNVGLEKAKEAAAKIGGAFIAVPEVPADDSRKFTDFNDVGVESTRATLAAVIDRARKPAPAEVIEDDDERDFMPGNGPDLENQPDWVKDPPPLEAYGEESRELVRLYSSGDRTVSDDWKEKVRYNDKGKIDSGNLGNVSLFLDNDKVLSNLFCYDEFKGQKIIYRCPPWENADKFKPHRVHDNDITYLTIELERRGLKQQIGTIAKVLDATIKNKPRNPAVEYFSRLKWDGVRRLDSWLQSYCGANFDDAEYVSAVGRKWLCAAVKRVLSPGCKFDYMPVFEGPQGLRKSALLEELATIHGERYFDDTIKVHQLGTKDVVPKLQGVLIVELAEMSGFSAADVEEVKQEITITVDRITQKYQNEATEFPRKFVFAGTINPRNGYLKDPTGNRRFWPIRCSAVTDEGTIDVTGLSAIKEQLWAEAKAALDAGEKLYLSRELEAKAFKAQESRASVHPWEGEIEQLCLGMNSVTNDHLWQGLKIDDRTKRSKKAYAEISDIMTKLGYEYKQVRDGGERERRWVKKQKIEEIKF